MEMTLLTVPEVALVLQATERRVKRMAREGRLPSVRLGRSFRFDPAALRGWIAAGGHNHPKNGA